MLALLLAVACSLTIGLIFKYAAHRGMDRMALLTVNYAVAMLFAVGVLAAGEGGALVPGPGLLLLGLAQGVLFIAGFFLLALATEVAGMSLAIGVMRVSVVLPFVASWLIWAEVPSAAQVAGLGLAGGAFFLIAWRQAPTAGVAPGAVSAAPAAAEARGRRPFVVLILLFVTGGLVDILMKTFDEAFAATTSRPHFLLLVFCVAFALGLVDVLYRGLRIGRWPARATVAWGVVLGLVNYGSAEFFLRAIDQLSGPFVFPANNIAQVVGGALLGVFVWREHLSRLNWLGLGLAVLALVLLNL